MRKSFSLISGSVKIRITGRRPERILNKFSEEGVKFRGVIKASGNTIVMSIPGSKLRLAAEVCENSQCIMTVISQKGVPHFLKRFRKRYVLFIAPVICFLAAMYLSFFIWEIEVTGNETITKGEILTALEEIGVGIGTFGPGIDQEITRSEVLEEINKLSWLTVNVYGCRAEVIVRERTDKPEIINEKIPTEVRAGKTGIITRMNVYAGKPLVKIGDTVILGETLITGMLESRSSCTRYVHAMGDILARTWYEISAGAPLEYITKNYTGKIIEKNSLLIGNLRLNLYLNAGISMLNYDKITTVERLNAGGFFLPVSRIKSEYREYYPQVSKMDEKDIEAILKERLLKRLDEVKKDAELVLTQFEVNNENGIMTVTLRAECSEQIGVLSPLTVQPPAAEPSAD